MKEKSILTRQMIIIISIWTLTMTGLCLWFIKNETGQTNDLLKFQAHSFFKEIVTTRSWNSSHGGVYVPVTSKTQPNQFLKDPNRDVITKSGQKLTKINPAFMTRQIGEIAKRKEKVWFHITSAKPIRPANIAEQWELGALKSFKSRESEYSEFINDKKGRTLFRYMAPLWTADSCLKCHSSQGYKAGDLRGGISVTVLADSILNMQNNSIIKSSIIYFTIWIVGISGVCFGYRLLKLEEKRRITLISELQESLSNIEVLSGLVPICSKCKNIRDDKGFWNHIETYVERHSTAKFSHGLCPTCEEKLYGDQEWFKKKRKKL